MCLLIKWKQWREKSDELLQGINPLGTEVEDMDQIFQVIFEILYFKTDHFTSHWTMMKAWNINIYAHIHICLLYMCETVHCFSSVHTPKLGQEWKYFLFQLKRKEAKEEINGNSNLILFLVFLMKSSGSQSKGRLSQVQI